MEIAPAYTPIAELVFDGHSLYTVTWVPFETYVDYRGEYQYERGDLTLTVWDQWSTLVPEDADLSGTAGVVDDELLLLNIWLGTPLGAPPDPIARCGHRFRRLPPGQGRSPDY